MNTMTAVTKNNRPASLVDWSTAPQWVSVDFAAFLVGVDVERIHEIVMLAGVDAIDRNGETLIDRDSLREFWDLYHAIGNDDRLSDDP